MTQIREEACFTKGRVIVRGKTVKRGEAKKADYILYYKPNLPIAVIEAKDSTHSVGDGMQQAPLTRQERAEKVKKLNVFGKYAGKAREVLDALLEKYADTGIKSVESLEILKVDLFSTLGTPIEIIHAFGGKSAYLTAIRELESALYQKAA